MPNLTPSQTMTSREIADLTGKRHADVLRDIDRLLASLNADLRYGFKTSAYVSGEPPREYRQYELDRDSSYCVVAGYDVNSRMRIIKRWQELEAQAAKPALPDFTNPAAWADECEAKQIAEQKVIDMQPKADFHDRVTQSPDLLTIREAAKLLRTGERRLFGFLKREGLLMASNLPYQPFMDRGLFRLVETPWTDQFDRQRISVKTCVTQKGLAYIHGLQDRLALYAG